MSYNFNSIPSVPPTGTVAPFTGTTDPSGWVICDGTTRSNASGQYNNLINAGLINQNTYSINTSTGSGISTNYLPATYTFNQMATSQNGQLILAGHNSSGYLYLSTNRGYSWAIQNNSLSANWFTTALSATNGQFMLAGSNSFLYLSTNTGTTWQPISGPTFGALYGLFTTTGNWSSSAISNAGQYMLAGMNTGSFYLSTSFGNSWRLLGGAANTNGMPTTAVNWSSCSMNASGSLMGACVSTGAVYLSTNTGTNWSTAYGLSTSSPWSEVSIASSANYMVAAANSGNIFLSTDGAGATWSQKTGLIGNPPIVAVGSGTNTIAYSYDGINYTGLGTTVFTTSGGAVASNGSRWVAVGSGSCSIAYSDDGINWTKADSGALKISVAGLCVTWDGIRWLAGGDGSNSNKIAYSADGATWTTITTSSTLPSPVRGIASNGSIWIAVGGNNSAPSAVRSSDYGITWTLVTSVNSMPYVFGITYANSRWIISSNATYIFYSTDSINWTIATVVIGLGNYSSYSNAYANGLWVVGFQGGGNNPLGYSTNNGVSWVPSTNGVSIFTGSNGTPYSIAWTGSRWVATGTQGNTLAYSSDGITWTGNGSSIFTTQGNGVAWNGLASSAPANVPLTAQAWQSLAISGDGTDIIAGTSASIIYASTTSGQTWTTLGGASNTIGLPNAATSNWSSMAISQDGNTWLADVNGAQMYISTDGQGKLWGIKAGYNVLGTGTWNALTISQDGTTVVAGNTASNLFVSYDSGNTYNALSSNGNLSGTKNWRGSTISSNNQIMTACATGDYVYLSSNSGLTWMSSLYQTTNSMLLGLPTITSSWQTISMDYTGTYHLAGINSGNLYLSTSSGKNWLSISGSNGIPGSASAWNTTTINSTGQYALAGINGGALYMSTNFATTWTAISGVANNLAWQTTAMNSTGEYMLAGTNNTVLYLSSNSGVYWNIIAGQAYSNALYGQGLPTVTGSWYTSAISSTGQYMATGLYGGAFYFSNNYGKKWNAFTGTPLSTSLNWQSMSMSSSGLAIVASVTGSNVYNITTLVVPTNPTWTNYGISQMINTLSGSITLADVRGVAVSDIGTLLLADRASNKLYISNNSGVSWSAISGLPSISFSCVDISQDGTQMLASANVIGYGLYVSSSSGANWRQLYTANGLPTDLIANDFGSNKVAISNDGTKIAVAYTNGFTYFSSNSGASFQNVSPPSATGNTQGGQNVAKNYWGLGMSKDGSKLVTAVNNGSYIPNINNINWITNPGTGFVSGQGYWATSLSYSGQYVLVNGTATYISSNYGNNWFTASGPTTTGGYYGGAVSATGQYMYSGDNNGAAYISSSYGQNWKTSPTGLSAVGGYGSGQFSSTGQYVAIGNRNGIPYLSSNFGNSFITLTSFNSDQYYGAGISATGQYIIFGGANNTYISSNYGVNWTNNPTGIAGGFFVSISGNGQYMLISKEAGDTNTVLSSNYGKSFTQTTVRPTSGISVNYVSYTGQFMMAAVGNGNTSPIYFSSSYGVNWVQNPGTGLAATNNYRGLSMSANAQYMIAVLQSGGNIYFVRNPYWTGTGATFNTTNWLSGPAFSISSLVWSTNPGTGLPGTGNWYGGASISYSGQYMIMANWNSSVYLSNNYGQTWTIASGAGTTMGAAISGTGQYMVSGGSSVYVSTTYGQNWYIALTGQSNYRSGISGSGQYILTGGTSVFYSSNYGVSFNSVPTISLYAYPTLSATGQYMAFPGNTNHNLSTSYGQYWTTFASSGTSICSCISATGQYIAFGTSSSILLSTTYGASFYTAYSSSVNAQQMSISYSGQYIAAANTGAGMIVMSSNYGKNWTTSLGTGLAGSGGYAIAISGNAQYILSAASAVYLSTGLPNVDGGISYSSDSGNNWSFGGGYLNGPYHNSVAISGDGSTVLAGYQDEQPYLSTGSSNTFLQVATIPSGNTYGMSLSNTGQHGILTQNNGKIYYTATTGSTWQTSPSTLADDFYAGTYISGNGQYMVAAADGNLYTSFVRFTPITIPSITSTDGTTVNYIIKI